MLHQPQGVSFNFVVLGAKDVLAVTHLLLPGAELIGQSVFQWHPAVFSCLCAEDYLTLLIVFAAIPQARCWVPVFVDTVEFKIEPIKVG